MIWGSHLTLKVAVIESTRTKYYLQDYLEVMLQVLVLFIAYGEFSVYYNEIIMMPENTKKTPAAQRKKVTAS